MADLAGKETGGGDPPDAVVDERDMRPGLPPASVPAVRIATYNVHSCVGTDAKFAPDRIAEVINGLDVDIVGLQEVGWHHRGEIGLDQFEYLARATGYTALSGPTKHHERAHYGNAILTRLPVGQIRRLDLTIGAREPRGALDVDVEVDGRLLRVIVAHLGLDPWERNAQITRILQSVDQHDGGPTVFMGDLNEWRPNSLRLRRLLNRFPDCAAPRSFHVRMPTLRLDRIFVSDGLVLANYDVVRTVLTRHASDHLPVRATLAVIDGHGRSGRRRA